MFYFFFLFSEGKDSCEYDELNFKFEFKLAEGHYYRQAIELSICLINQ